MSRLSGLRDRGQLRARHIKHCDACGEPHDQALRTATLLGLLPAVPW